ncbi:PhzF family phenazine biosynthesis protein [Hydrogenophaga sp. BPS33]|uniref:PhzF family phenazine biosynthesis protein n=1 Tax=Hydrogenophaga sp. BPS33 TaxID=2651974 RepID=UPI00131F9EEF|nr:PhzF family phenazine biosynthesis protein [Hydrogenophaga sp. BPS33]QHE88215.1 PhzF family phenazine biosynthesis protein [Hydrogenophaga sp. BPS33]
MAQRPFQQVDVFTDTPYLGNPLGVVLDGSGLDTEAMQRFTDWTNLSECTFLLPPTDEGRAAGADYRVRIFCPGRELPFAGHPTLGSCHAWLRAGGRARADTHVVQECGVGLVHIRRQGPQLAFAAPPLRRGGPLDEADLALIARGLGLSRDDIVAHAWCDNGPAWRGVMLRSAEQVLAVRPDAQALAGLEIGLVGPHPAGTDTAFEVRAFFPGNQALAEDPVTGSLNAAIAQWLMGAGMAPERYVAAQGTVLARAGRVYVERDAGGTIWIGGASVTCIDGKVSL